MHRFFVSEKNIKPESINVSGEDAEHISKVLRLRIDDRVIVCDGNENEYICAIRSFDKRSVSLSILEKKHSEGEPAIDVCLFQGIPKSAKMDLIVQKCTELGIYKIIPVDTEHVVAKIGEDRDNKNKLIRWQRIAEEAAKQSGRGRIPIIGDPIKFQDAVKTSGDYELCVIPYEKEGDLGLKQVLKGKANIRTAAIMIGPEGGFSEGEISTAFEYGWHSVTLGPRILRTETAGFVCLSLLGYELGDLGGKAWRE